MRKTISKVGKQTSDKLNVVGEDLSTTDTGRFGELETAKQ